MTHQKIKLKEFVINLKKNKFIKVLNNKKNLGVSTSRNIKKINWTKIMSRVYT